MDENKKLEFRGSSFMALVPFAIFIVITIALSFFNAADTNMMIGVLWKWLLDPCKESGQCS